MEKIQFGQCPAVTEDGDTINLTYYLLVDEIETDGSFAFESYGVGVEKRRGDEITYSCCRYVSFSQTKIEKLLTALMRGTVTPVALADVVEDWE